MTLRSVEAVAFDFDGVLADSTPAHAAAWEAALDELGAGGRAAPFEVTGLTSAEYAEGLVADLALPVAGSDLVARKQRHYAAERERVQLFPGVPALLDELAGAGLRLAVATNEGRASLESILARTGVLECFDALVTRDDVARTKPAPDPYATAARLLSVQPARCLAVEDTAIGLASARAAGLRLAGVLTSQPAHLLEAELLLDDVADLAGVLLGARA